MEADERPCGPGARTRSTSSFAMHDGDTYLEPDGGEFVDLGGLGVRFKVRGSQTGGAFSVVEHPIEPGVIVEPHTHQHEDELSYVLEGTIWARVGDREIEAPAGSFIWKPRNMLHTFWNPGRESARILETITPAGFENFFEELAAVLQHSDPPDDSAVYELCNSYGLTFDRGWLPELESRFGEMRMV